MSVPNSLKTPLAKWLNELELKCENQLAFSRGGSRKHVKHRKRFEHMMQTTRRGYSRIRRA